jgi:hypothetical protein
LTTTDTGTEEHEEQEMADKDPVAELLPNSSPGSTLTAWGDARGRLAEAPTYWVATVHPDGRPNVVPVLGVVVGDGVYFCTYGGSRKDKNLATNSHCVVTFGKDALDLVVEGKAAMVIDAAELGTVGEAYAAKYGWKVAVRDGTFFADNNSGIGEIPWNVYGVKPTKAFGFATDKGFSATRWSF